jgi:hypothetical protein
MVVRGVPLGGLHTWDFVPGSDARGEIPSTATQRVDDVKDHGNSPGVITENPHLAGGR